VARPPVVQSLLVADAVIQDRATGKWSVIGVFDRLLAPAFPCVHPSLAVYVRLADAQGAYAVRIEFRDSEDRCVASIEGIRVEVAERTRAVDFGVVAHGLRLDRAGLYHFQLYLNGEFAASVPLEARPLPPA
jgi:hypothetical protein